jgi:hypothetical protein
MRRQRISSRFNYNPIYDVYEVDIVVTYVSKDGKTTDFYLRTGITGEVFRDSHYKDALVAQMATQMSQDLKQQYKKRIKPEKLFKSIFEVLSIIDLRSKTNLIK